MTSFQPARTGQANSDVTYSCSRPHCPPLWTNSPVLYILIHNRFRSASDTPQLLQEAFRAGSGSIRFDSWIMQGGGCGRSCASFHGAGSAGEMTLKVGHAFSAGEVAHAGAIKARRGY
jgi:hypothetical protein